METTNGPAPPSVVLDTNLFVAAYWNSGSASASVLRACEEGRARLFYSEQIRREVYLILRSIKAPDRYRQEVDRVFDSGTEILPTDKLSVVEDDPDDDKFLECAQASNADYLVTSDDHLLRVGRFGGTEIVKPAEFRKALHRLLLTDDHTP